MILLLVGVVFKVRLDAVTGRVPDFLGPVAEVAGYVAEAGLLSAGGEGHRQVHLVGGGLEQDDGDDQAGGTRRRLHRANVGGRLDMYMQTRTEGFV